jgi:hypothetical protein
VLFEIAYSRITEAKPMECDGATAPAGISARE